MRGERQTFSREFKLEAVRLMEEGKKPPAELARELGIRRNQLYKWKWNIGDGSIYFHFSPLPLQCSSVFRVP